MSNRPTPIFWAVVLTAINAVGGVVATAFWPDLEDRGFVLTVSIVGGLLLLVAAYFLWNGNFWGAIGAIALNALNIVAAIPGYFDDTGPDSLVIGITITIALSVGALVGILMPAGRAFWRRGSTPAAA